MSSKSTKSTQSNKSKTVRREINYEDTNVYPQLQQQFPQRQQQFPQRQQQFPQRQQQQQFPQRQQQPQYSQSQQEQQFPQLQQFPEPQQQQYSQPQQQQQYSQSQQEQQFPQLHYSSPTFMRDFTQDSQEMNYAQMLNDNTDDAENDEEEEEEEEEIVPTPKEKQRKSLFTEAEDIFLAKAYVRISENSATGNDNKIAMFWLKITNEYNSMINGGRFDERNTTSLKNRFTKMRAEVVLYKRALHMVNSIHHTGENEMGMLKKVNARFMELNDKSKNRAFAFNHVLEILNDSSKFNYTTTRNRIPSGQEEGTNSYPTNGSPQSPIGGSRVSTQQSYDAHSGDKRSRGYMEEDVSSPKRPIGSKAAKRAERLMKKGKGKESGGSAKQEFSEQYFTRRDEELEFKREAHNAKLKVLENNMEMEARRLSIREEELRCQKEKMQLERDQKIMDMDVNQMPTDEEKAHLWAMKSAILRKWSQQ